MSKKYLSYLFPLMLTINTAGDENSLQELTLEELLTVKIASLQEEPLSVAPSSVTLITKKQLKTMGIKRLQDLLNYVPGFQSTRDIEQGTANRISARGRSTALSESVLIQLDGQRLNDLYTGGVSILNRMFDLGLVDRIEIIRGPGSALYGSNAFLGVINIISVTDKNEFNIQFDSHGEKYSNLTYSNPDDSSQSIDLYISVFDQSGDNYHLTDIYGVTGKTTDPIKGHDFYLKYKTGNWLFSGRHMQRTLEDFLVFAAHGNGINQEDTEQMHVSALYSDKVSDKLDYSVQFSHSDNEWETLAMIIPMGVEIAPDFALSENFIGGPYLTSENSNISARASYQLNKDQLLSFGISLENSKITDVATAVTHDLASLEYHGELIYLKDELSFNDKKTRKISSFYIQDHFELNEYFTLTAGFRYDNYSDFGRSTNPRLALTWAQSKSSSIKLLFGTAFRAPNFLELYDRNNVVDFGNKNLDAEEVTTSEFGWVYNKNIWSFELTWFDNQFKNLIVLGEPVIDPDNPLGSPSFTNHGSNNSSGLETVIDIQVTDIFSIILNWTRFSENSEIDVAKNSASLILDLELDKFHFNVNTFYHGNNPNTANQGSYSVTNFNGRYQFSENVFLLFSAENISDEQFRTTTFLLAEGIANPGRLFRLGAEYHYK